MDPRTTTNWQSLLLLLASSGCGDDARSLETAALRQEVIGGVLDTTHRDVVGVFVQPALATGIGFCSGFLVAPNLVMTARHCVSGFDVPGTACADEVVAGVQRVAARALPPEPAARFAITQADDVTVAGVGTVAVAAVHVPPDAMGKPNCGHDIALLELSAPVPGAPGLALRAAPPVVSETFTALGYGFDGAVANSDGVRRSRSGLGVEAVGELRTTSGSLGATDRDWVATLGPCGGDSGAPALDTQDRVIGVMSRGNPRACTRMIYTQVSPYRAWVMQIAREAAVRGAIPLVGWVAAETMVADAGAADAGRTDAGPAVMLPSLGVVQAPPAGCTGAPLGLVGPVGAALWLGLRRRRVLSRQVPPWHLHQVDGWAGALKECWKRQLAAFTRRNRSGRGG